MSTTLFLTYLLTSLVLIGICRRALGLVLPDVPNERSSHIEVMPRAGGLIILVLFLVENVRRWYAGEPFADIPALPAAGIVFVSLVGLVDDYRPLSVSTRLFAQAGASIMILHGSPVVDLLSQSLGSHGLALTFCLVAGIAFINFYNFMDGIDGLVGGCVVVQLLYLGAASPLAMPLAIAAMLSGFLFWNWHPSRIFLGDCGSYLLGSLLLYFGSLSNNNIDFWRFAILTLPLTLDPVITLIKRLYLRRNILSSHRDHIYQHLAKGQKQHPIVSGIYIIIQAAICFILVKSR